VSVVTQAGAATLYAPLGLVAAVAGGRASQFLNRLAASVAAAHPARVVLSAELVKPGGAPARSATLFDEDGLQAVLHALDVPGLPAVARARLRAVADALPGLALAPRSCRTRRGHAASQGRGHAGAFTAAHAGAP